MIPDFQTLMLPFLKIMADEKQHTIHEIYEYLCSEFGLTDDEKATMLPSGNQTIMHNRVGWTRTYLKKAGLISSPQRAIFCITDEGKKVLSTNPARIDVRFLYQYPEFKMWQRSSSTKESETAAVEKAEIETGKTPEELLDLSHIVLRDELASDLLDKIKQCSPTFFEVLVIELLIKMGYGGSRREAGEVMGRSGDGGIDGMIKEDKLGLDTIYIQAKRWEGQVTIHQVRDFAGSLLSKKAKKGIFITTSSFPASAFEFVSSIEPRIVLMDGKQLATLMIDHNVGVTLKRSYEVKRIDTDFFEEA